MSFCVYFSFKRKCLEHLQMKGRSIDLPGNGLLLDTSFQELVGRRPTGPANQHRKKHQFPSQRNPKLLLYVL